MNTYKHAWSFLGDQAVTVLRPLNPNTEGRIQNDHPKIYCRRLGLQEP